MRIYDIIHKKREGGELSKEEISFFIKNYSDDTIKDYHAAALIMAAFINGLSDREIIDLTTEIMYSGNTVDLSAIEGVKVDKHSTGGVGDTTTLVLAPLVASLGVPVAKMSGRGLGHTGGTVDKLESIKGFKTELGMDEFIDMVNEHKISVIGQSKNIAPADKKLYALRDVTATIDHIGLIASSIMSKKLAAGSDAIVLDVKIGSGAFLKSYEEALQLAKMMVTIGEGMGRKTRAVITNMDQPLGEAIGNALEVQEAMDVLNGKGPKDLRDLCVFLGANMLLLSGTAASLGEGIELASSVLDDGRAYAKFEEFIKNQGGESLELEKASVITDVLAPRTGYLSAINSEKVGSASVILGAGRVNITDAIDHSAGIEFFKKIGDAIEEGEVIARIHTNMADSVEAAKKIILENITIGSDAVDAEILIVSTVYSENGEIKVDEINDRIFN